MESSYLLQDTELGWLASRPGFEVVSSQFHEHQQVLLLAMHGTSWYVCMHTCAMQKWLLYNKHVWLDMWEMKPWQKLYEMDRHRHLLTWSSPSHAAHPLSTQEESMMATKSGEAWWCATAWNNMFDPGLCSTNLLRTISEARATPAAGLIPMKMLSCTMQGDG